MSDPALHRILGGSPPGVALRLVFLSLVVGALMSWLDIDPFDLVRWLEVAALHLYATGFDGLRQVGHYIAIGAVVVVPAWLVMRLLGGSRRKLQAPRGLPPEGPWRFPGDTPSSATRRSAE